MTTTRHCAICSQRFVVTPAHQLTCCAAHRLQLAARRATYKPWSMPPMLPCSQRPHRVRAALAETRAAVERLQAEGRRLHALEQETSL